MWPYIRLELIAIDIVDCLYLNVRFLKMLSIFFSLHLNQEHEMFPAYIEKVMEERMQKKLNVKMQKKELEKQVRISLEFKLQ